MFIHERNAFSRTGMVIKKTERRIVKNVLIDFLRKNEKRVYVDVLVARSTVIRFVLRKPGTYDA